MKAISWSITLLLSWLGLTLAFDCSLPPIYVDLHKRIVHGTDTFQYGAFTGVGTPGQNQSLWPSLSHNETTVANIDFCKNSPLVDCERSTRGNYDTSESSTFEQDDTRQSMDSSSIISESVSSIDTFYLYTHYFEANPASATPLKKFPFQTALNGTASPGILGLGQSSSLLQRLFSDGLIAGRTLGLSVGSGMDRAGGVINGSISFGGYDAGRFRGDVHNYTMDTAQANPLTVTVTDIIIDQENGPVRNVSLFDKQAENGIEREPSFNAQITTDVYPLALPFAQTQAFKALLSANTSASSDGSLVLPPTTPPTTLTIVLSTGLRITLPPSVMRNTSNLTPIQDTPSSSPSANTTTPPTTTALTPLLSTVFLSQVYLMLDYDSYGFHLAAAVAEPRYVVERTFCPRTVPTLYVEMKRGFWSQGLIGAVVGAVLGGMAVVALAACAWCAWRRRVEGKVGEEGWEGEGSKVEECGDGRAKRKFFGWAKNVR